MELNSVREIIIELKAVKNERHLSITEILELVRSNGDYLSETTIRRVFADDSEQSECFSYDKTLRPIAKALLFARTKEEPNAATIAESDGLKAIIRFKNHEIDNLHEQLERLHTEYDRRITFLLSQIEKKDRRMDQKDEIIQKLMDKCL